jgi:hypothetical protein
MKPSKLILTIIALAAGLSGANAAQLFTNGNMDTFNSGVPTGGWYATGSNVTPSQESTNSPFVNAYANNSSSFKVIETGGNQDGYAQAFSSTTNYQTVTVNLDFMVPTLTPSQAAGTWGIQFDGGGASGIASSSIHYRIDRNGNFSIANGAGITDIVALEAGSWYNIQATFITTAINDGSNNGAGYQFGSITKSGGATTSWNNVAAINTSLGYSRLLVRDRSAAQSSGLLIDNISVVNAIPEPSSALLLLGGGSLLAFRRRRASI